MERGYQLVCSATTKSGKEQWQRRFPLLPLCTPPLLTRRAALATLRQYRPDVLILELLEIWPSWVKTWSNAGVKIIVVDGRISRRTHRAQRFLRPSFRRIDLFCAQTKLDAQRATDMGCRPSQVVVCGDGKLDSLLASSSHIQSHADPSLITPYTMVIGCTRPRDERPMMKALSEYKDQLASSTIMIAPRHLKRLPMIERRAQRARYPTRRASDHQDTSYPKPLILLDRYGVLRDLYQHTPIVIIGGTFYDRGQNLLEAALAGCAVIYGPQTSLIRAQHEALSGRGGYQVKDWNAAILKAIELRQAPPLKITHSTFRFASLQGVIAKQLSLLDHLIFSPILGQDQLDSRQPRSMI